MNHFINSFQESIAFWKYPNKDKLYSTTPSKSIIVSDQHIENTSGFVFKPFDNKDNVFLIPNESNNFKEVKEEEVLNYVIHINQQEIEETKKEEYINAFNKCKSLLDSNQLKKIVLSRKKNTLLIHQENALDFFIELTHAYSNAFIYFLYHPKMGCWVGATPEPLLVEVNNEYQTVALAASRKKEKDIHWNDKEIEEQFFVSDYIHKYLLNNNIDFNISEPHTSVAGNVSHLKTTFSISKNNNSFDKSDFIKNIHPSPAICGLPKKLAKQYIQKIESNGRGLYTGYIGTITNGSVNLFINLRCAQIFRRSATLYVGGGITKASNIDSEWNETIVKSNTLLNIAEKLRN